MLAASPGTLFLPGFLKSYNAALNCTVSLQIFSVTAGSVQEEAVAHLQLLQALAPCRYLGKAARAWQDKASPFWKLSAVFPSLLVQMDLLLAG